MIWARCGPGGTVCPRLRTSSNWETRKVVEMDSFPFSMEQVWAAAESACKHSSLGLEVNIATTMSNQIFIQSVSCVLDAGPAHEEGLAVLVVTEGWPLAKLMHLP